MRVQGTRAAAGAVPPDLPKQLVLGEDALGLSREDAQQLELLVSQHDRLPRDLDGARREVELELPDPGGTAEIRRGRMRSRRSLASSSG